MNLTTILFLIFFVLVIFHFYIRYNRCGRLINKLPGPTTYPLIGNILSVNISSNAALWKTAQDMFNKYYPIFQVWTCTKAVICTRDPDDFQILLKHQRAQEKSWMYDNLQPWLANGLITSKGKKWHQRRKLLTPSFHFNLLSKYMDVMHEQSEYMLKLLQADGNESVQNIITLFSTVSLNIISETAMGVTLNALDKEEVNIYTEAIHKLGEILIYRLPRPYIQNWMLKLLPFLPIARDQKKSLEIVNTFTNKIIKERKEYHASTGNNLQYLQTITDNTAKDDDEVYKGSKKRMAMLDLLLAAEQEGLIDEEGIKEEVKTFTFAGHDTSTMAMTFTLLLLAENKEAQEKARAEIKLLYGECGGKWKISDLQKLHYVEQCIKESLRLYPTVPFISRHVVEDVQLKNVLIPAGSTVLCNIYALHRDPNFWPNHEKFDPDRWSSETVQHRHPFAYLPFSAGPRNCIGQKYAMTQIKSLMCYVLYNYYLEPITPLSSIVLSTNITIEPSELVYVRFIKIDSKSK